MGRKTTVIPKAPLGRILMRAGAKRVSADAVEAFTEILTEITEKIATQAAKISKHSGRKTVNEGDVKLASEHNF
jgi:histone H3/H4